MTHYQKLATMIFRILGLFFLTLGFLFAIISIVALILVYSFNFVIYIVYANFNWLPLMLLGMFLFSTSRSLAKGICFDFDRFND